VPCRYWKKTNTITVFIEPGKLFMLHQPLKQFFCIIAAYFLGNSSVDDMAGFGDTAKQKNYGKPE